MKEYKILHQQVFENGEYSIVPIRFHDRHVIRKWRNEQIYHLRQSKPLSEADQDHYFESVVTALFEKDQPDQLLFSYLKGDTCIGYGGLVHINWRDKHAEISFVMETSQEETNFEFHWVQFLGLIEKVAFEELDFHKIFTYAFDLRPRLYTALENAGFSEEARLADHCFINEEFYDVLIHSKFDDLKLKLREARLTDIELAYKWVNDPTVRQFSFDQKPILWPEHKSWFSKKITEKDCHYYILSRGVNSLGSIRFDLDATGKEAMISFLIDPDNHKQGLGKKILEMGVSRLKTDHPAIEVFVGYVFRGNIASIKIFEQLGFNKVDSDDQKLRFEKSN